MKKPYLDSLDTFYNRIGKNDYKIGIISLILMVAFVILLVVPWLDVYGDGDNNSKTNITSTSEANRLGRSLNCKFWSLFNGQTWDGNECHPKEK
jgi:hypothetical protein